MVEESAGFSPAARGDDELCAVAAPQAAVGSNAAAGSDWSSVRRFMDGIVAEDLRRVQRWSAREKRGKRTVRRSALQSRPCSG